MSSDQILYIKGDRNVEVSKQDVTLGDIPSFLNAATKRGFQSESFADFEDPQTGADSGLLFLY